MPSIKDITNVWNNIKEVDLRPIREEALRGIRIVMVGAPGSGRHSLAAQMRKDPARPQVLSQTPITIAGLDAPQRAENADLIIVVIDASAANATDFQQEQALARQWADAGKKILVFANKIDLVGPGQVLEEWVHWPANRMVYGSAQDTVSLQGQFIPAMMEILADRLLALGRQFPLFRVPIARQLINETCFSNATYSISTGIAEIVPALGIPLNITDMIVLTKAQAFLVYKLGLALGLSTRWQDYVAEFGSVIGGGFMWRQLARQLVGLIPVWGIVPKVAVAYSGTYVVGHTVLQWYLTGRHISREQMRLLYRQAFDRGKGLARRLTAKAPRLRIGRGKERKKKATPAALPAPEKEVELPQAALSNPVRVCPNCQKPNAQDARFCQYCGKELDLRPGS